MRNRNARRKFLPVALAAAAFVLLCSCDAGLRGPDSREIAGGYRLKKSRNSDEFALTIPDQLGGLIIDEVGWHQPFIVARGSGSEYWEVIDTSHAQHTRISDHDLKADPAYQAIEVKAPAVAWEELGRNKPLW